jgi:hypothetical protein
MGRALVVAQLPQANELTVHIMATMAEYGAIHANKTADAQTDFDHAANLDPTNAALYRVNETIFFFQAGDAVAQVDAGNARLYYFKAQGLTVRATVDAKAQKLMLPPGCADAYRKYLVSSPFGQFADDAKTVLAAAQPGN